MIETGGPAPQPAPAEFLKTKSKVSDLTIEEAKEVKDLFEQIATGKKDFSEMSAEEQTNFTKIAYEIAEAALL